MVALRTRVIESREEFDRLEPLWNDLLEASGSSVPFLTHEYLDSCWKYLCNGVDPLVLIFEKGREIVGLTPLAVRKWGPLRVIGFLGGYHADYQDFIIDPDVREEAFDRFFETMRKPGHRWDLIDLRKIREDSPSRPYLKQFAGSGKGQTLRHHEVSPFIEIGNDWKGYLGGIRKKLLKDTERQRRRLERLGDLHHRRAETTGEIDEILDIYHRQKGSRIYRDTVARNTLGSLQGRNFLVDFTHRACKNGWLAFDYLSLDHVADPLAISISLRHGNRFYYWLPSINDQYLAYSPGRILLVSLLQDSFLRDLKEFDFLSGGESYKYQWLARDRRLYRLALYASGVRGFIGKGWMENLRPRLRRSGLLTYSVRWTKKILETGRYG